MGKFNIIDLNLRCVFYAERSRHAAKVAEIKGNVKIKDPKNVVMVPSKVNPDPLFFSKISYFHIRVIAVRKAIHLVLLPTAVCSRYGQLDVPDLRRY